MLELNSWSHRGKNAKLRLEFGDLSWALRLVRRTPSRSKHVPGTCLGKISKC